ncbi:MAG: tetratricopeptide repeat protein, partial [Candidatus Krumholzibacteria bacterium]|nr:tetratricopeptide repeat protein [Candidatus Krumholzibacteria bacterium]
DLLPDNPNIRFNLAVAKFALGEYQQAAVEFASVAEMTPADPEVFNNLGSARFSAGDLVSARRDFLTALQLHPNYPSAVLNLCELEQAAGDPDAALGLCAAYLEHHRDLGVLRRFLELQDARAAAALRTQSAAS